MTPMPRMIEECSDVHLHGHGTARGHAGDRSLRNVDAISSKPGRRQSWACQDQAQRQQPADALHPFDAP